MVYSWKNKVYSQLLLSTGGGIISPEQQADQAENMATLLIGLGGTGIDCLAEIKKAVRARLKPDDPEAPVPQYQHIQFLAVDVGRQRDLSEVFDDSEYFEISYPKAGELRRKYIILARREMDWLDPDKIRYSDMGDEVTWGFRQAGRYAFINRSYDFLCKVRSAIQEAQGGNHLTPVYIHLLTGLCGTMGSGAFLDACYLIRKAIDEEVGENGKLFGYFFLPDVNLSKISDSASLVKDYVARNGYAAMQELDYCMRMGENGDGFTQTYKGGIEADWREAPVDMCHLISAADKNSKTVPMRIKTPCG